MRSILPIWRIWMLAIGQESLAMRTVMSRKPLYIIWEVGTTGSRYNEFKVRYSARNNLYVVYKNMPVFQLLLNLPFLLAGGIIKYFFFRKREMGGEYFRGLKEAFPLMKPEKKVRFRPENFPHYVRIQMELWGIL